VAAILTTISVVATSLPAWRATRVDPMKSIQSE
jgi:ABC-type lipoprotein release transport system permease subunit